MKGTKELCLDAYWCKEWSLYSPNIERHICCSCSSFTYYKCSFELKFRWCRHAIYIHICSWSYKRLFKRFIKVKLCYWTPYLTVGYMFSIVETSSKLDLPGSQAQLSARSCHPHTDTQHKVKTWRLTIKNIWLINYKYISLIIDTI